MDLNLNSINNYIDVNEANSTNIGIVPDSTLDVGSFDSEAIRYWNESLQQLYEKYKEYHKQEFKDFESAKDYKQIGTELAINTNNVLMLQ